VGLFDVFTGDAAQAAANAQIAGLRAGYNVTTPGRAVYYQPRALLKFQEKNTVISTTEAHARAREAGR